MAQGRKSDVHVEFHMRAVQDKKASREAGRPIFKDVEYVRIRFPGDNKRMLEQPAHEKAYMQPGGGERLSHAEMYPDHYALFKQDAEQVIGTPIEELPALTASQRATLKAQNVRTVEALAGLDGTALKSLGMNGRALKDKAAAYLDAAAGSAGTMRLVEENAGLKDRMAEMEAMLAELSAAQAPKGKAKAEAA